MFSFSGNKNTLNQNLKKSCMGTRYETPCYVIRARLWTLASLITDNETFPDGGINNYCLLS